MDDLCSCGACVEMYGKSVYAPGGDPLVWKPETCPDCGDDVGEPGSRAALEVEVARLRFELAEALPDAERFRVLVRMSEGWPSEWHVGHHGGHPPDAHVVHLTVLRSYFTGATFVEAFDKAIAALDPPADPEVPE